MTLATTLLIALLTATNPSSDGGPSDPILLDFHADWCGPCRQMAPAVDQLSRKGYPVQKVDIDRSPALAKRYGVEAVPTFVVVDRSGRELDRTSGLQPAGALERFYLAARGKARAADRPEDRDVAREDSRADDREADREDAPARPVRRTGRQPAPAAVADSDRDEPEDGAAKPFTNPHPIKTVVRIKVQGPHSTGFGSGTIIYSTPEQSVILTCAHIFKLEGRTKQVAPGQFPHQIVIDLFDGQLHQQPTGPPKANYVESFPGRAVDYDFNLDVGLIVFRPGRQLPASRVVPSYWQPRSEPLPMKMLTVGCSEGKDATAWHTRIMNPRLKGFLQGQPSYEAIECENAPKQGRSGGGLFTTDGHIAGVCNFAEPQGNHGLYATPRSIYSLLDRNNLAALYAPVAGGSGTLVADGRKPSGSRPRPGLTQVARSQSPDSDEPDRRRPVAADADAGTGDVLLPHYSLLGIKEPVGSDGESASPPRSAPGTKRRVAWHQNLAAEAAADGQDPSATPAEVQVETSSTAPADVTTNAGTNPTRPRWRPANAASQDQ
jgi:thiol-disulfide isomerase/thioredoxin